MIPFSFQKACYFLSAIFLLAGCTRNETKFYGDAEQPGIAIFSNTGNNLFSCYIDGKPWRTVSRTTVVNGFGFPFTDYEVKISKQSSGAATDTLTINWMGYYGIKDTLRNNITLRLVVSSDFGYKDMIALQGQRLTIDGNTGYFSNHSTYLNVPDLNGSGHIYFHSLVIDSVGPGGYSGLMSGLLDADFGSSKITNGRFDHTLSSKQVQFR